MHTAKKPIDALKLILERNSFYRQKFHTMAGIFLLSLCVIAFLASIFLYVFNNKTRPLYFAADDSGQLVQESPLNQPLPADEVLNWTIKAIEASNSFDFVNYRVQLQSAQKYFTDYSWGEYMKAWVAALNLVAVKERKEVWLCKVMATPKITGTTIANNAFAWKIELIEEETRLKPPQYLPIPSSSSKQRYKITAVVQRKSLLQSYKGLVLLSMVKEPIDQTAPAPILPAS